MPLNHSGILVWIADSLGNELPEYETKIANNDKIECWIPSTEGSNFKIMWKILEAIPQLDLGICPDFDGLSMEGAIWGMSEMPPKRVGELDSQPTGSSTVNVYEFGKMILTDREDAAKLSNTQLQYLNTIRVKVI